MTDHALEWIAAPSDQRLDKALAEQMEGRFSRTHLKAWIESGAVLVDGRPAKITLRLKGGERVTLMLPQRPDADAVQPEAAALTVYYEDADLAVLDKPAGMIVHPGVQDERGTLVAALLARWPQVAQMPIAAKRAGIVHRLDKDTSGLMVVALTDVARRGLMAQFAAHTVEKVYLALLACTPPVPHGHVAAPLAPDPDDPRRRRVFAGGEPALTDYAVLQAYPGGEAFVRLRLHTGRTHQVRVHMAHLGCPLVGDRLYGGERPGLIARHCLHAAELRFTHPLRGTPLAFESPLPDDMARLRHVLAGG